MGFVQNLESSPVPKCPSLPLLLCFISIFSPCRLYPQLLPEDFPVVDSDAWPLEHHCQWRGEGQVWASYQVQNPPHLIRWNKTSNALVQNPHHITLPGANLTSNSPHVTWFEPVTPIHLTWVHQTSQADSSLLILFENTPGADIT